MLFRVELFLVVARLVSLETLIVIFFLNFEEISVFVATLEEFLLLVIVKLGEQEMDLIEWNLALAAIFFEHTVQVALINQQFASVSSFRVLGPWEIIAGTFFGLLGVYIGAVWIILKGELGALAQLAPFSIFEAEVGWRHDLIITDFRGSSAEYLA